MSLTRIGFLMDDLGPSQTNYTLIRNLNRWLAGGPTRDAVLFINNPGPPCIKPECAIMSADECAAYDGVLVATDFHSARRLLTVISAGAKVFYSADPVWMRGPGDFAAWQSVYADPRLLLAVRSEDHRMLYEKLWHRPVVVWPDCDPASLGEVLP